MSDQIGVIGAGAWGTTLAVLLADAQRPGQPVGAHAARQASAWPRREPTRRYLPGVMFPPNVRVVTDDA